MSDTFFVFSVFVLLVLQLVAIVMLGRMFTGQYIERAATQVAACLEAQTRAQAEHLEQVIADGIDEVSDRLIGALVPHHVETQRLLTLLTHTRRVSDRGGDRP